jgi:hypothetical protein
MKLSREALKQLILNEVNSLQTEAFVSGPDRDDFSSEANQDQEQQYINFIVAVQEAARETLEEIERGVEPYKAASDSRFNQIVRGFTDEEFYHYFFG